MFQRVVCFKFKNNSEMELVERHMVDFRNLKALIPQIMSYRAGKSVPGDKGKIPDYDCVHYLTFTSLGDRQIYIDHEAHQKFINNNKSIWENVFVIDSEVDE